MNYHSQEDIEEKIIDVSLSKVSLNDIVMWLTTDNQNKIISSQGIELDFLEYIYHKSREYKELILRHLEIPFGYLFTDYEIDVLFYIMFTFKISLPVKLKGYRGVYKMIKKYHGTPHLINKFCNAYLHIQLFETFLIEESSLVKTNSLTLYRLNKYYRHSQRPIFGMTEECRCIIPHLEQYIDIPLSEFDMEFNMVINIVEEHLINPLAMIVIDYINHNNVDHVMEDIGMITETTNVPEKHIELMGSCELYTKIVRDGTLKPIELLELKDLFSSDKLEKDKLTKFEKMDKIEKMDMLFNIEYTTEQIIRSPNETVDQLCIFLINQHMFSHFPGIKFLMNTILNKYTDKELIKLHESYKGKLGYVRSIVDRETLIARCASYLYYERIYKLIKNKIRKIRGL